MQSLAIVTWTQKNFLLLKKQKKKNPNKMQLTAQ